MEKHNFAAANLCGIQGRTALITGGTSGIGFMMAQGLIVNGAKFVIVTGMEPEEEVHRQGKALRQLAMEVGVECRVEESDPHFFRLPESTSRFINATRNPTALRTYPLSCRQIGHPPLQRRDSS
jgi:NAD(P)-dependent dehydrogenase (short-subunit alcohol dehydrogenase family)